MKVHFAGCTLDTDARRVCRGNHEVHLSPKAFELLTVLVEHRSRALPKAELLERVWPGVFVSDASLARVVTELRKVVGDRARHARVIRTVHGFGYAFAAEMEDDAPRRQPGAMGQPACWLLWRRGVFALVDGEQVAGRDPAAAIWLDSPKVSRQHARVLVRGTTVAIEDLGSKNGTFVHGVRISGPTNLAPADDIRIGPFRLIFRIARLPASTETQTVAR